MPQYTVLVGKAPSPLLACEGHSVSECPLSGLTLCPLGDGRDLPLGFVPALGSTALQMEAAFLEV